MAAVDSLLEPGERVLQRTGLHWMAFGNSLAWAGFVALVVTLLIRHNDLPLRTDLEIAGVGALVAALGALPAFLRWRHTAIVVTERRVLLTLGALRRRQIVARLSPSVLDQRPSGAGRWLNYGTLTVSPPGAPPATIAQVARAGDVVEAARNQARRGGRRGAGST